MMQSNYAWQELRIFFLNLCTLFNGLYARTKKLLQETRCQQGKLVPKR